MFSAAINRLRNYRDRALFRQGWIGNRSGPAEFNHTRKKWRAA